MISKGQTANMETLKRAFANGDVALMEVTDSKTGELIDALCAVSFDGKEYQFSPLAFMVRENPFERFTPPMECTP